MAITRTQIAKQLLANGGRIGLRFGSEGYQGGRTDQGGAGPGEQPDGRADRARGAEAEQAEAGDVAVIPREARGRGVQEVQR